MLDKQKINLNKIIQITKIIFVAKEEEDFTKEELVVLEGERITIEVVTGVEINM